MIRTPEGESQCLDFRETSPRRLVAEVLSERTLKPSSSSSAFGSGAPPGEQRAAKPARRGSTSPSVLGGLSVGVPGTVAGFAAALEAYGTWSWDRVVGMVIDLAETGTWLTTRQSLYLDMYFPKLSLFPSTRRCFTDRGIPPLPGGMFRQPDLAITLRLLAEQGPGAFYSGPLAEKIVRQVCLENGVMEEEDLAVYAAVWREPLRRIVGEREFLAPPLPSGGGFVLQTALGLLASAGVEHTRPSTDERAELLARVFRVAFALRARHVGDPDVLSEAEVASAYRHAQQPYAHGDLERLEGELFPQSPAESLTAASGTGPSTTHYSVIDPDGGSVSVTYSLNTTFGSKLTVQGAGFLLNNSIDDFAAMGANWYEMVEEPKNALGGRRRPASSMCPVLVVRDQKVELVIGAAGGPRIPTAIAQTLLPFLLDGCPLEDAIRVPRVHHQCLPDVVVLEEGVSDTIVSSFVARGRSVERHAVLGLAVAIHRDVHTNRLSAALDPRPTLAMETME